MKTILSALLLTGAVGLVANPSPADAQGSGDDLEYQAVRCAREAEASCNQAFPPSDWRLVAVRGWCYMIRTAICMQSGEETQLEGTGSI